MEVWGLLGWGDVGASGGYGGVDGGLTCVGGDCGEMSGYFVFVGGCRIRGCVKIVTGTGDTA